MYDNLISVIIPAYNAESTIFRCLKSIQDQTYSNIEIIVVNDGSIDNTEKIVREIINQDGRVNLITIPNGGVSHARNVGINKATGEYITFVDSDDYIDEMMYEKLINIIKKYEVKIAHCSYKNVDENDKIISTVGGKNRLIIQDHDEAVNCIITGSLFVGGLWNKVYHRSLFTSVRLNENIKYKEDILANFQLFDQVEKSVYIDDPLYNYVAVETSSTHAASSIIPSKQSLFVAREINKLSKNKNYEYSAKNLLSLSLLSLYKAYSFINEKKDKTDKKILLNEILSYKAEGFYGKRDRLLLFVCRYFPFILKFIFRFYDKIRVKKLDPKQ